MFLKALGMVAAAIDGPATEEVTQALESSLHYFQEAAPKHTADEEESLFPRLRQVSHPEVVTAFSKLDQLEDDHRWAAPLHHAVERLGRRYLLNGVLSPTEVLEFRNSVASLAAMYQQHIAVEDKLIFPLASQLLSETEKSAIANEMAKRRRIR